MTNPNTQPVSEIPTCHAGHEPLNEELSYWVDDIEGTLPKNLTGTFFRNGPGRLKVGNDQFGHWFDGDGMLCAFSFVNGKVHFKNRYVRTPKYVKESETGRIEFRGFGTQRHGGLLGNLFKLPANPANTSIAYHGDHLLALNEGGKPFKLLPDTLETVGEYTYEGELGPANVFSAHGKIEPKSGYYFNFGSGVDIKLTGMKGGLNLYRINPQGKLDKKGTVPLDTFPFCHDCAITDRYGIYFINSIVIENGMGIMLGSSSIADNIAYKK
ncbi:MAG: carotenoid oxygenase family protein, partial [Pseudomonadota bacterium]